MNKVSTAEGLRAHLIDTFSDWKEAASRDGEPEFRASLRRVIEYLTALEIDGAVNAEGDRT